MRYAVTGQANKIFETVRIHKKAGDLHGFPAFCKKTVAAGYHDREIHLNEKEKYGKK